MKKQYIQPESRLFVINLEENIASSGSIGNDEVSGNSIIKFTHGGNGCRDYYTGYQDAPNTKGPNASFGEYYEELELLAANNFAMHYFCFKHVGW